MTNFPRPDPIHVITPFAPCSADVESVIRIRGDIKGSSHLVQVKHETLPPPVREVVRNYCKKLAKASDPFEIDV